MAEWRTESGNGWTMYNADCLDVLPALGAGSVDAVVTDPPFTFAGGHSNGRSSLADAQFFVHWWRDVCREIVRAAKAQGEGFLWCDWRSASSIASGFSLGQIYTWKVSQMLYHYREMPGQGTPFRSSVDQIAYIRGPKSTGRRIPNTTHNLISKYWYYGKHPHHPAEKDPDIASRLLDWCSDGGDLVLDPFAGSGTTGVACINTGRRFVGVEIDPGYFDIAVRRLRQAEEARQPSLPEAVGD